VPPFFLTLILKQDRPIKELLSARYSFLNERLANFYGIPDVRGSGHRLVDLHEHPQRGGILGQGSFLVVTSNPTRTSPVKRGLFVLENILGTPAPPAPPDVPELKTVLAEERTRDFYRCLSEKMLIYAIGRGLEYFDAVTINNMVNGLEKGEGSLKDLAMAVIQSAPFQKRRGD